MHRQYSLLWKPREQGENNGGQIGRVIGVGNSGAIKDRMTP